MAILDLLPGFHANIWVDTVLAKEYEDDEDLKIQPGAAGIHRAERTVSKYIESVSGKAFEIEVLVDGKCVQDCPGLGVTVFLDGVPLLEKTLRKVPSRHVFKNVETVLKGGSRGLSPLVFSHINITSEKKKDELVEKDKAAMSRVGEICIEVHRRSEIKTTPIKLSKVSKPSEPTNNTSAPAEVSWKAVKGDPKSHGVSFGPTRVLPALPPSTTKSTSKKLDGAEFPRAIFRFKYRSELALKQLLIIPRTPEPEEPRAPPRSAAIDLEGLDADQIREAERYIEKLRKGEPGSGIKREHDGSGNGNTISKKAKKMEEILVLDLTASDDES